MPDVGHRRTPAVGREGVVDRVGELVAVLILARRRARMSQRDVSHACFTSQSMIARIEDGRIDPPLRLLVAYADAVGAPLTWAVGGSPRQ